MRPYPSACTPGFPKPTYRNPDWHADYDERYAPVPGWGVNPMLACPSQVGVGAADPGTSPPGSSLGGLAFAAGLGMLAAMGTRAVTDRGSSSGTTYAYAAAAGVGGAIAGGILAAVYCFTTLPTLPATAQDVDVTDPAIKRCAVALTALVTLGAVSGGVLVGRRQAR